ncbi:protein of unknown function [Candidatus Nitrotoga arctica]|uniref:Uncharacterized protein n=1 Tax=Candidatus Nitrotoga arctica TaxID=453162 RepID=A0ABN8ALT0_9PROT|nr:protein of unknown function [Candidatus Nitrotoga arctica]
MVVDSLSKVSVDNATDYINVIKFIRILVFLAITLRKHELSPGYTYS